MKNILITGAKGFVGSNLTEFLSIKTDKYKLFTPSHKELELLDMNSVKNYIEKNKINIVIHGANVGGGRKFVIENALDKNLRMFFNIVNCIDELEKIILLGTGAEYNKATMPPKVTEEDFGKVIPLDEYGFSKFVMSKYIEKSNKIVSLRLFGVYGKYEDYEFKFISNAILKNLLKMPIDIMQNVYFDYLNIDDCVKVIEWFIENKGEHNFYNLSTGKTIDLVSIVNIINKISSFKSEIRIKNSGLNNEYSADNLRLCEQIVGLKFKSYEEGIEQLYHYYENIFDNIDKEVIINDPYAAKCDVKK